MNRVTSLLLLLLFSFGSGADPFLVEGKKKARLCTSCHGPLGISRVPSYPNLAGQKAEYLAKQLRDYKTGKRQDPQMSRLARSLSEQEINELSLWFASLKR